MYRVSEYGTKAGQAATESFHKVMSPEAPAESRTSGLDMVSSSNSSSRGRGREMRRRRSGVAVVVENSPFLSINFNLFFPNGCKVVIIIIIIIHHQSS